MTSTPAPARRRDFSLALAPARILLVEEQPARSLMLTLRLKGEGYKTATAFNLDAALVLLDETQCDLIITDLTLGNRSGFELCRAVREHAEHRLAPVLMLTTDDDPGNILRSLEAGVDAFLPRSAGTERIVERVGRLLDEPPAAWRSNEPDAVAARVRVLGHEYRISSDREHLLSLLVSAFEDVVGLGQSLSDREKATAAKLASVLDTVPGGILVTDASGDPTRINEGLREMLGLPAEAKASRITQCVFRTPAGELQRWNDLPPRRTAHDTIARFGVEMVATRVDGTEIPVIFNSQGVFGEEGRIIEVVSTLQSIEERERRKRAESQLALAERMASVGTLAAGVAHEINNPLTWVLGNLDELEQGLEGIASADPAELLDRAREASEGARRIRAIVKALKTFSHGADDRREPVQVESAIEVALKVARNELRFRATVERSFGDTPPVLVNEGRLSQVFLNLVVNASQAFVTADPDVNLLRLSTWADGDQVVAEVRDNGPGISAPNLSRLFDPFFTTKPVGVGSGLGLSICHNIIRSVDGSIEVESEIGTGTAFRVRIPRLPGARPSEVRGPPLSVTTGEFPRSVDDSGVFPSPFGFGFKKRPAVAPGVAARVDAERKPRVLVVDDEPLVAAAISRVLRRRYDVSIASSGREALAQVRSNGPWDAIVSDLMMDDGSGMELHEWLTEDHPDLARRTLFLTGGAFTEEARRFLLEIPNPWLEKPVQPLELRAAVERLARPPTPGGPGTDSTDSA